VARGSDTRPEHCGATPFEVIANGVRAWSHACRSAGWHSPIVFVAVREPRALRDSSAVSSSGTDTKPNEEAGI